jgi:hypothetical protein
MNAPKFDPSYHISGYHRPRELSPDERDEPCYAVQIPMGFETLDFAVSGHGLCESDAEEAVREFHFPDEPDKNTESWIIRRVQ